MHEAANHLDEDCGGSACELCQVPEPCDVRANCGTFCTVGECIISTMGKGPPVPFFEGFETALPGGWDGTTSNSPAGATI